MFQSGHEIGNYTLVKQLGRGSYGEVWMALRRAKFVTTRVAVKLPLNELINHDEIKHEAILWEKASGHPNVLPIIEADEYDDQIVIVSEFAPDGSLEDLLKKEGKLPVKQALEMATGIAQGLKFLHSRRIIHRDIKPANILLQGDTPRLTDFGLSRLWLGNSMSMEVSGTPFYMAPEAFNRKRNEQTDVWSFGVVLYEMVTGEMPFSGGDIAELYASVLHEKPRPIPDEIPLFVQKIIFKALERSTDERYSSVSEMLEDLHDCLYRISGQVGLDANTKDSFVHITAEPKLSAVKISQEKKFRKTVEFKQAKETREGIKRRIFKLKYIIAALLLLVSTGIAATYLIVQTLQPIPFRKGDKFGYSTWSKRLVIGAKYDLAMPFSNNLAVVGTGQKNTEGKFSGKYGFIDKEGREMIPLEFDYAESFADNLAKVGKFDAATNKILYGFIDSKGEIKVPLKFEDAQSFSENLAAVKSNGKWGFVNETGDQKIAFQFDSVESFSEGFAAVKINGKYGFINNSGVQTIAPSYDFAGNFVSGIAPIEKGGKAFFIDSNGASATNLKYDRANRFSEGLAMVEQNGKAGFIETNGVERVAFQFENAPSVFSEGLASVKMNGKKGFIDRGGETIIPFKYLETEPFKNNLARVKNETGIEFYVGYDGTEFYEPQN